MRRANTFSYVPCHNRLVGRNVPPPPPALNLCFVARRAVLRSSSDVLCMYTVALDHHNLDSLGPAPLLQPSTSIPNSSSPSSASFDGTMAYAQHKRCQVEMTERWAQCAPAGVQFLSMHPGHACPLYIITPLLFTFISSLFIIFMCPPPESDACCRLGRHSGSRDSHARFSRQI